MTANESHSVRALLSSHRGKALLGLPAATPHGIVLFVHGSGSSRHSPRNAFLAAPPQRAGFATLLYDLLAGREAADRTNVFDIALLSRRFTEAVDWTADGAVGRRPSLGFLSANTGVAATLMAASGRQLVHTAVGRGGRPDLAGEALVHVEALTLLIIGSDDSDVPAVDRLPSCLMHCGAGGAGEIGARLVPAAHHGNPRGGTGCYSRIGVRPDGCSPQSYVPNIPKARLCSHCRAVVCR